MRGNIGLHIGLLCFLIIGLFVAGVRDEGYTKYDIMEKLQPVEETLFNLTENIHYSSMYAEEGNMSTAILNIAHGFVYGIIVEMNTLMPLVVHIVYDHLPYSLLSMIVWGIIGYMGLYVVFNSSMPIGVIYVFTEQWLRRRGREWNKWVLLLFSIGVYITCWGIVMGLTLVM